MFRASAIGIDLGLGKPTLLTLGSEYCSAPGCEGSWQGYLEPLLEGTHGTYLVLYVEDTRHKLRQPQRRIGYIPVLG